MTPKPDKDSAKKNQKKTKTKKNQKKTKTKKNPTDQYLS